MSNLPPLTVVAAGAGSGKTFKIKETVGNWVKDGLVHPDRIVAVTFTEAAAVELKERLRQELIDIDRIEDALKLDQSYISTIHSFGLRILTEFAFNGGLPPVSRLLERNEETALTRQALAKTEHIEVLTKDLSRYGYRYDGGTHTSAEDQFRKMVQEVIARLRTISSDVGLDDLETYAEGKLKSIYGPIVDGNAALGALHRAVQALLAEFSESLAPTFFSNVTARKEFEQNFQDLLVARDREDLSRDWKLWHRLQKMRITKRGSPTPPGYDELASDVVNCALALRSHPGPLEDAMGHARALIQSAKEAIDGYNADKRQAGLMDYTDMVATAHMILASQTGAIEALASRVDCLVIDEFQDTNPLQFALLWLLQKAGIPTLIVGDLKQAIMGFQGADPRLMKALLDHKAATVEELPNNWRTQPSLMPFVNKVGSALFGDQYSELEAKVKAGCQPPLEIFDQPKPPKGGSKRMYRAGRIAARIQELLGDETQRVIDRDDGKERRLVASDIAILCPNNGHLTSYAASLQLRGIKTKISQPGWYSSSIVQFVLHGMEIVADPSDRHAELFVACSAFGSRSLQSAISDLIDGNQIEDPILDSLRNLRTEYNDVSVNQVFAGVTRALDLYRRIDALPDAPSARADLLKLDAETQNFAQAKPETLAAGGFFGSGVKTFRAWLKDKVDQDKEADLKPDPDANVGDAVEMVSWHRSKGREWPVVFVCGWDASYDPRLPDISVDYDRFDDIDTILQDARLSFLPGFVDSDARDRFKDSLYDEAITTTQRLIYVALTRARERLVIEWHSHLDGGKAKSFHSVLRDIVGVSENENGIEIDGEMTDCIKSGTSDGLPPMEQDTVDAEVTVASSRPQFELRPIQSSSHELFWSPSGSGNPVEEEVTVQEITYGPALSFGDQLAGDERGTIVHRVFEVLAGGATNSEQISEACGYALSDVEFDELKSSHEGLMGWIAENLEATRIETEVAFSAQMQDGSLCTGLIDLLIETPDGYWIIDHKTDRNTSISALTESYWPQLKSYKDALESLNCKVVTTAINFPTAGKLLLLNPNPAGK